MKSFFFGPAAAHVRDVDVLLSGVSMDLGVTSGVSMDFGLGGMPVIISPFVPPNQVVILNGAPHMAAATLQAFRDLAASTPKATDAFAAIRDALEDLNLAARGPAAEPTEPRPTDSETDKLLAALDEF